MVRRLSRLVERPARWRRWRRDLLLALAAGALGLLLGRGLSHRPGELASRSRPLLGTVVEIQLPGPLDADTEAAVAAALDEMARVERLLAPWRAGGGPSSAAESLEVDHLLERGREVTRESGGALDLRMRDWVELWGFETRPRKPADQALDSLARVRVRREPKADLREFTFGCVAAGYALDRALAVLKERGVARALVNAGGEVGCLGSGWSVGVQDPRRPEALLDVVALDEGRCLSTSADTESRFQAEGREWHHLLVPATGRPARDCQSVTVLAPTGAEADLWSTALFVMGPSGALALAHRHAELEVLVVDSLGSLARSAGWTSGTGR
jgi:thiamine biosynthesis lipoprotein